PGYPHGVYHYVLENLKGAQADIGCYHGVVSSAYTQALQGATSGGTGSRGSGGDSGNSPGGSSGPGGTDGGRPGGPPPGGGPPPSGPPSQANQPVQTAYSLAANTNEDDLLRAVLAVSGNNYC
ncbi:MAG: hypothetical protein ACREKE_09670, partial [bacterium]